MNMMLNASETYADFMRKIRRPLGRYRTYREMYHQYKNQGFTEENARDKARKYVS